MLLGLAVFATVYALLAVPRLGRRLREAATARWGRAGERLLSRPGIALVGAGLVVLVGAVAPLDALRAVDLRTLALLTGMMLLVATLDAANVLAALASLVARAFPTPARLLVGSMLAVAILSALVLNDAVVLLFTPVLVRAARAMGTSPLPFLVGEALAANLGSAATPTGNPQNAAIATAWGLGFVEFAAALAPVAAAGVAIGIAACALAFARDLRGGPARPRAPERLLGPAAGALAIGAVVLALMGFVAGERLGLPLWLVAAGAGGLALALAPAAGLRPVAIVRRVDVGILGFFVGLFVLVEVVRASGALDGLFAAFGAAGAGGFVAVTAVASNVVSNVPAVLLLLPSVGSEADALLLAGASTFAGNATFLGSAATVIVAEAARREGADFSVLRFTLVGLPVSLATLGLVALALG